MFDEFVSNNYAGNHNAYGRSPAAYLFTKAENLLLKTLDFDASKATSFHKHAKQLVS